MKRVDELKSIMEMMVLQIHKMEDETGLNYREDLSKEEMLDAMMEFGDSIGFDWVKEDVQKIIDFLYC